MLAVKFSATKNTLDVIYKHIPIHKTYEERAPPPRKDSKRRKFLEENDPEALRRIQNRPKPSKVESEPDVIPKPKKKQRSDDSKSSTSLESDLRAQSLRSLLELIRPDPAPEPSPPEPPPQAQLPPPPPQPPATAERGPVQQQQRQQPQPQTQATPQPPRKRLRNSCNSCKQKKTKVCSIFIAIAVYPGHDRFKPPNASTGLLLIPTVRRCSTNLPDMRG